MNVTYTDQAWLYDIAFAWDVEEEIDWLLGQLGAPLGRPPRSVMELGCGSARMMPGFARRGVAYTGVDRSAVMLARALQRAERDEVSAPTLIAADMSDFAAPTSFDGAICMVQTFGYLPTREAAARHLACVAKHLGPGARYMVQLDMRSLAQFTLLDPGDTYCWEEVHAGHAVRCTWSGESFDPDSGLETQVAHFEVLAGEAAGQSFTSRHSLRVWDWDSWRALIDGSPFRQVAAYDGDDVRRPPIALDAEIERVRQTWHVLERG